MRKAVLYLALAILTVAGTVLPGYCHRPLDIAGSHSRPEQALLVSDIDVSQVAYEELTEAELSPWMKVELSGTATPALRPRRSQREH